MLVVFNHPDNVEDEGDTEETCELRKREARFTVTWMGYTGVCIDSPTGETGQRHYSPERRSRRVRWEGCKEDTRRA